MGSRPLILGPAGGMVAMQKHDQGQRSAESAGSVHARPDIYGNGSYISIGDAGHLVFKRSDSDAGIGAGSVRGNLRPCRRHKQQKQGKGSDFYGFHKCQIEIRAGIVYLSNSN